MYNKFLYGEYKMDPMLVTGLAISLIFIFMAIGTPVFAALGLSGIFGVMMLEDLNFVIHKLQAMPYYQSADYLLTVIPLFILMGAFVHHSGIGETLFGLARKWGGH